MNQYTKKTIQNVAIFLLYFIGVKNIIVSLPVKAFKNFKHFYHIINPQVATVNGIVTFLMGFLMILLAYRLYKRVRMAWIIEVISLIISIFIQIQTLHLIKVPIIIIEAAVLLILICSYKDFSRKSDRITVKRAIILAICSFILLIVNAAIGLYLVKADIENIKTLYDAFISSISLLVFMDTSTIITHSRIGSIYVNVLIVLNWTCIILSTLMILKPLVYNRISDSRDKEKVRKLVLKYGQNAMAYLSLEDDKKYFFSTSVEGVCSYTIVGNVLVCCGDIICDYDDGFVFLSELMKFCKQNGLDIMMLNVTEYFLELYKLAGFGAVKYGEDACFQLSEYNLVGGKVAKVRAAINHATKSGIEIFEYNPTIKKDLFIEEQINEISKEWLNNKESSEMSFMLGGTGLDDPMDRRYFYAKDRESNILGFVVFLPYLMGKAYLADVTRRRNNAPQGVLEKIIYEGFMKMKDEGIEWGNMGLSPLYNVTDGEKSLITEKLFNCIYENMNNSYGFKALHHSKKKYAPTDWQSRYLVYNPKPFSIQYAYAIIKSQNPKGIKDLILSEIKKKN